TWEPNHIPIVEHPSQPNIPWEDKPYIVADPTGGNLYVGWTRWTLSDSQILLARSTDEGLTWAPPVEINGRRGLPRDDNVALERLRQRQRGRVLRGVRRRGRDLGGAGSRE